MAKSRKTLYKGVVELSNSPLPTPCVCNASTVIGKLDEVYDAGSVFDLSANLLHGYIHPHSVTVNTRRD